MEERKKCTAMKHRDTHMHEQIYMHTHSLYGFRGGQGFEILLLVKHQNEVCFWQLGETSPS